MAVNIANNEHVFIAGRTGSGKTWLARKYLSRYETVIALDTKGTLIWPEAEGVETIDKLEKLKNLKAHKIIYRPVWEELEFDNFNRFFKYCYMRKNMIVWIDEVMSVCPNPLKIPDYYKAILTRGRELNVAAWSLTQRPAGIPALTMSEASHFFVFDLNMKGDREKIASITGAVEFLQKPSTRYGKYTFWYYNVEYERAVPARLIETKGGN